MDAQPHRANEATLCLAAIRHTPHPSFVRLLDSTTNPSHRAFEYTVFSLLRRRASFAKIATRLQRERTHALQGMVQLREALERFYLANLLKEEGLREWVEWRVATWPRRPSAW